MASLNKVLIIGNLGRDPETRFATEGACKLRRLTLPLPALTAARHQATGRRDGMAPHRFLRKAGRNHSKIS